MGLKTATVQTHLHLNVKVTAPIIWPEERSGYSFILRLNTCLCVGWTKPLIIKELHSCKIKHEKICAHAETLGLSSWKRLGNQLRNQYNRTKDSRGGSPRHRRTVVKRLNTKHKPASSRPKGDELTERVGSRQEPWKWKWICSYTPTQKKWTKKHSSLYGIGLIIKTLVHVMSKEDNIKSYNTAIRC